MVHISFQFLLVMLIFGGSVQTVKKNTVALEAASKKTGLEVNAVNAKYTVMSRDQNAGQSDTIKSNSS